MVGFRRVPDADADFRFSEDQIKSDDERSLDDRSIAADSWSVKSEYGSTLDGDDQRHVDVTEAMASIAHEAIHEGWGEFQCFSIVFL
jgi:hypothetical protein